MFLLNNRLFYLGLVGLLWFNTLLAQDSLPTQYSKFVQDIEQAQEVLKIPGLVVGIMEEDSIIWQHASGWADIENQIPVHIQTLFPVASVTKPFAAILILQLVAEGKLSLDDPVYTFVPHVDPNIKIKHVLSHTSQGVPGETFEYSYRYGWLTDIIERVSKQDFDALFVSRFLKPLKMTRSIPGMRAKGYEYLARDLAKPYYLKKGGRLKRGRYPGAGIRATNGLVSTLADLAKFSVALDQGILLNDSLQRLMVQPFQNHQGDTLAYAQGWFSQSYFGHRVIWHYGEEACFSSLLLKVPEKKLTLIALANSNTLSAHGHLIQGQLLGSLLTFSFLKNFLNDQVPDLSKLAIDWTLPEDSLRQFFTFHSLAQEQSRNQGKQNLKMMLWAAWGSLATLGWENKLRPVNYQEERKAYQMALKSQLMMYSYRAQKDSTYLSKANTLFDILIQLDPHLSYEANPALLAASRRLKLEDQAEKAEIVKQIALNTVKKYPYHSEILYETSQVYKALGQHNQARAYLEQMLAIPNHSPTWYLVQSALDLGAFYLTSDPAKAKIYLNKVLKWGWNTGGAFYKARRLLRSIP